jgi:RNA-directed DNA polymerase
VEQSGLAKRKPFQQDNRRDTEHGQPSFRLERLGKVAKQDKDLKFNNLIHHITPALLLEAFKKLNRQAAKRVDNMGWQDYAKECEQRLTILHEHLQSGK